MLSVLTGFFITLIAYLAAKPINKRFPQVPLLVIAMFLVIGILLILRIPYEKYNANMNGLFSHLLGSAYV